LMRLLQEITTHIPAGTTLPLSAGSPMQWAILSTFERESTDQGKVFEHYSALSTVSNETIFSTPISIFEMKTDQHRITNQINGMPVGRVGTHYARCFLREKGATAWNEQGRYPIKIHWTTSLIALPN
jgi:hypothetical protein